MIFGPWRRFLPPDHETYLTTFQGLSVGLLRALRGILFPYCRSLLPLGAGAKPQLGPLRAVAAFPVFWLPPLVACLFVFWIEPPA